jgi:enamine deaminase RidA (YjgF/YER057c/UK114 family)
MIRRVNVRSVVPPSQRWYYDEWHLSPLISHGGFAFLSGVTGSRPDGSCADTHEREFIEAFEKLGHVLDAAGLGYDAILELTTYHIGMAGHLDVFRRVKDRFLVEPWPAWSAIGVSELAAPGSSVELRAVCRMPEGEEQPPGR